MLSSLPRKVKIVCTLGPSTQSLDQIKNLILAGMDIARLNFSHGDHAFHEKLIQNIREASKLTKKPIAIMQDLQGPKLRVGKLSQGELLLKEGDTLVLHPEGPPPRALKKNQIALPISAEIAHSVSQDVKKGAQILFDDGKMKTTVLQVSPPEITVQVEVGGRLTDHKGMNLPGTPLSIPCITEKDEEDLEFGLKHHVDAIALSFVRSPEDIEDLRDRIKKYNSGSSQPMVIAKIEREEAIEVMDSIIQVTDGILIARGDMAVEIGPWRVPTIQKSLIHRCNELGVPVITATQMLESMITSSTPTRAEASDVANAVFDGTDCVMLSGETASGKFPFETVKVMSRIILESERSTELFTGPQHTIIPMPGSVVESVEFSASRIANHVGAVALATITHSGVAARALAKFRPQVPIIAITENEDVIRRLQFVWSVRGIKISKIVATDNIFHTVEQALLKEGWAELEDLIVITAGVPTLRRGTTNMIKVHRVTSSKA